MIGMSTNDNGLAFYILANSTQIIKKLILDGFINKGMSMLYAENEMNVILDE